MRLAIALILTLGTLSAAPVPKEHRKSIDDKLLILGTWQTQRLTVNGTENAGRDTSTFVFETEGRCHTLFGQGQLSNWKFSLDPTTKPKRLKWMNADGSPSHDCIYEIEGDSLKVGFLTLNAGVPAKVEPGAGLTLYELKREKSSK